MKSNDPFSLLTYDYELPEELIASHPIHPKNQARLLVYNRKDGSILHTHFSEFERFIPQEALIVFNDTKVIKARFFGKKESGGGVELLYHKPLGMERFWVQIKGRVKLGQTLLLAEGWRAQILALGEGGFREVSFWDEQGVKVELAQLLLFLERQGHVPLPPYIKRTDTALDEVEYQSVFAKHEGAIAAPTASLHFEETDMVRLKERFDHAFVTLHVGAGTFLGVESEDIRNHSMHKERYFISESSAQKIEQASQILAIGTTAARTIEYYVRTGKKEGECDLFLHPGNPPLKTTALLTNFHLPQSTLLMLVSAFITPKECQRVYAQALKERYRFFSYGDGMLIL
ncbi:MAG: tRNA preQ1(34) S-adenosylmethionine ribosyltransferase-isomerase QueA [Desulfuromonadaceae bacterium]|uniref:tRNA preQ1(34) S-adenosylmethionine ribosyltransferase-isomerase QueA n=1 Tax=Wolinella succinogenes TaxID=844 RepID=UPI0016922538|nr:tRNA preQ1(34) S-adenosylmethionine ribosyltransferase-isomerase QueA [Wolinella succinogenes]MDY0292942.1 tRNA preQ1(34) S-adenosylmethionine ribosyltransferase-isomerase QueA [Desulfuromonadaceae bacterium]NLU35241.1 tRNA preQ1(34) S-adenosylmethionine ribosyltransferase-isomerase QueA [Wolinella succinogenes]